MGTRNGKHTAMDWVVQPGNPAGVSELRREITAYLRRHADAGASRFDLDQLLQHEPHGVADQIHAVTGRGSSCGSCRTRSAGRSNSVGAGDPVGHDSAPLAVSLASAY